MNLGHLPYWPKFKDMAGIVKSKINFCTCSKKSQLFTRGGDKSLIKVHTAIVGKGNAHP